MIEPLLQAERLLLHGMLEQAEQIYRRVAEQDPRNSIAVVGLARVAVERGDDEAALEHARTALGIDPDNAAAQRLEARLAEVLAERTRAARPVPAQERGAAQDRGTALEQATAEERPTASPPWSSSQPSSDAPLAAGRPSEQAVFVRNPSMADHRQVHRSEQQPPPPPAAGPSEAAPDQPPAEQGLLRRLLRRVGGG